ncbi:MAG: hypothetical protein ACM3OF_16430 [Gemmatimonas sp.]|jgi:hypothetical protein
MSEQPLPEEVRDLVLRHIDTVAQLEALLFLREHPTERWEAASVARRLYAPTGEMTAALAGLCNDGFLVREGELYRYAPSADRPGKVDALAKAYARQLIPITNLIHSKPRNIRAFSDAFKFRKD